MAKNKLVASFEQEELNLMTRVMEEVVKVKVNRLKSQHSIDGFYNYMLKFIDQLDRNEFTMTRADDNTCTWIKDQIKWCGLDKKGPITKEAKHLLEVLDQAIEQRKYFRTTQNNFNDMFDIK